MKILTMIRDVHEIFLLILLKGQTFCTTIWIVVLICGGHNTGRDVRRDGDSGISDRVGHGGVDEEPR